MKLKSSLLIIALTTAFGCSVAYADSVTVGMEHSSGTYGSSESTDITAVPLSAKINAGKLTYTLAMPLLKVSGPQGYYSAGNAGAKSTQSGVGDLLVGVTAPVTQIPMDGLYIDATAKAKLPTANVGKGLGTGKTDYLGQLEVYKTIPDGTLYGVVGYRKVGKTPEFLLQDSVYSTVGFSNKLSYNSSWGLNFDFRGAVVQGRSADKEITTFYSFNSTAVDRFQLYASKGIGDGSPKFVVGTAYTYGR